MAKIGHRFVNLGQPERPPIVADPGVGVLLPGNDTKWDQGVSAFHDLHQILNSS